MTRFKKIGQNYREKPNSWDMSELMTLPVVFSPFLGVCRPKISIFGVLQNFKTNDYKAPLRWRLPNYRFLNLSGGAH